MDLQIQKNECLQSLEQHNRPNAIRHGQTASHMQWETIN